MTDRLACNPDLGLADRIAAWLFPALYPGMPGHEALHCRDRTGG
jgi:hypothetical protein